MINEESLPSSYIPFRKLTICSNLLENGKVPVLISGNIPFLVGKGNKPKVWINMLPQQGSDESKPIVRENLSLHPQVEVVEKNNIVEVTVNDKTLIEVKKISNNEAVISKLDLRMIGIAIYGDSKSLKVGGNSMSKNTFKNVNCMIGFD
jgi:hypothetical protein